MFALDCSVLVVVGIDDVITYIVLSIIVDDIFNINLTFNFFLNVHIGIKFPSFSVPSWVVFFEKATALGDTAVVVVYQVINIVVFAMRPRKI